MVLHNELEADADLLLMHLRGMISSLRKLPADKWDWTFAPPAPTPRILAVHALEWLQCDRQHIQNPDAKSHQLLPEHPTKPADICDAMEAEAKEWETLLKNMKPEELDRDGWQFGIEGRL